MLANRLMSVNAGIANGHIAELQPCNNHPAKFRRISEQTMPQSKTIRVLLVDDNDMTRTLLRGMLVVEEYEMAGEANNGEAGLEMALRLKPDVICLDIQMPKTNGIEVLKQIKSQLPRTAVVMVTGSTERETVQAAITGGADGYIVKPFNSARVLDAIGIALAKVQGAKVAS
jgi:two-component system chemotaxis response regulator CheY